MCGLVVWVGCGCGWGYGCGYGDGWSCNWGFGWNCGCGCVGLTTTITTMNHQSHHDPPQPQRTATSTTNHHTQAPCVIIHIYCPIKQDLEDSKYNVYTFMLLISSTMHTNHRYSIICRCIVLSFENYDESFGRSYYL